MIGLGDVTDYPVHILWLEIMLDVKFAYSSGPIHTSCTGVTYHRLAGLVTKFFSMCVTHVCWVPLI